MTTASTPPILYENNLVENSRGRVEICGLGTGGTSNGDVTIRNNTFYDLARAFGIQGFGWDCDSGTGNLIENNVFADDGGGFYDSGLARTALQQHHRVVERLHVRRGRQLHERQLHRGDAERIPQAKRGALVARDGHRRGR